MQLIIHEIVCSLLEVMNLYTKIKHNSSNFAGYCKNLRSDSSTYRNINKVVNFNTGFISAREICMYIVHELSEELVIRVSIFQIIVT